MATNRCPEPINENVRKSMMANKSKDTKPELLVRRILRETGHPGYRLNWNKAPGKPDITYPGKKVAIFVNGCYWHRCPYCNLPIPKTHVEYWTDKFRRNIERDARNNRELTEQGWKVITVWECELKDKYTLKERLEKELSFL